MESIEHTVKYAGEEITISVPKRFATPVALAAYAADLDDSQFAALVAVLRDRRYTDAELVERVIPLRPEHPLFATPAE